MRLKREAMGIPAKSIVNFIASILTVSKRLHTFIHDKKK